jgi:hypothetical protein
MGRYQPPAETEQIAATLKRAAAALREAEVPFALAGSVACWARGGPHPSNDLDFAVAETDGGRALEALEAIGMRGERPPEGWLLKAYDGDVMVDLIWDFEALGEGSGVIARAEELSVEGVPMLVMDLEDVFVSRLCAMTEHHLDMANPLAAARALREQVDWDEVRARTSCSPYAIGFMAMLEALGVVPGGERRTTRPADVGGGQHHARVRVVGRA